MAGLPAPFMIAVAFVAVGVQYLLTSSTAVQGVVASALSLHSLLTWPMLSLSGLPGNAARDAAARAGAPSSSLG